MSAEPVAHGTREALLDAAMESLRERGYAATSARAVARRAGVSQGALQHHFPSKVSLVEAALLRLMGQVGEWLAVAAASPAAATERERCQTFLDTLWKVHNLPVAGAVLELHLIAHTDIELRERFAPVLDTALTLAMQVARQQFPTLAAREGFDGWLMTVIAAMRGYLLAAPLSTPSISIGWPDIREQLLRALG
ncbi:TetR/AcrR family transcriptional regulator [Nocardia sp. NPDC056064]|uniref:TetR/AcrR family transcriptional regulator n=1 Tax=Nocardia sp. NPDC056064 TaxID=3345701 RepID=UPI0035D61263